MFRLLIKAMRPKQWPKNAFVLAGIFFDGRALDATRLLRSVAALALFCLLSSAVYLINDLGDLERDRHHPEKKKRPLASGALAPAVAWAATGAFLAIGLPLAFVLDPAFGLVALIYVLQNLAYTCWLKHIVIVDVMVLSAGFVLRVYAGAVVAQVTRFSPWLYVCTTLLALFIVINKRRHELMLLAEGANNHRASLQEYSVRFLDEMTSLVTSTTLAAYSFYTFSAPNLPENHAMMLTIPFVVYGIFRYLYLIHVRNLGGTPEDILLSDRPLLTTVLLWACTAGAVIYWPFGG